MADVQITDLISEGTFASRPAAADAVEYYATDTDVRYYSDGASWTAQPAKVETHNHSGSDITSGTVADARIDSAIARDTEITATKLDDFATPDNNTDLNATTGHHGLLPLLDNDVTHFLNGQGGWTAPAASLSRSEATLSGDVTMTTANTQYDGPTLTPAAGVYDVEARCTVKNGSNATTAFVSRLIYGSTVVDEAQFCYITPTDNGYPSPIPLSARITADGATAIKIAAICDHNSAVMCRDPFNNSSAVHRATLLVLIKVG